METFDPVGGGFVVERIRDLFFGSGVGSGGGSSGEVLAIVDALLGFFRGMFIFFLLLLIFGIIFVIYQLIKIRPGYEIVYDPNKIQQKKIAKSRWEEILERFNVGTESDMRLAVIEADSLVDDVFKKLGYPGETLGERIASVSPEELRSINDLREAHGIRNRLVHTPGYKINKDDAERSIRRYQQVLSELEVI